MRVANGTVYDPANGVHGIVRDIWIKDGRVIDRPFPDVEADRTLDATGLVVMPGGIDMHAHIAGPKVNAARALRPEDRQPPLSGSGRRRSGTTGSVPSTFATGYLYAGLGYTTVIDAAIAPSGARHAHLEFSDTPLIDKGFLALLGNNAYVLDQLRQGKIEQVRAYVGWLLWAVKAYGIKLVNPGGVENWKETGASATTLGNPVSAFGVSARQIITALADAATAHELPHPVHIHCNNLGLPGNWATTLATMEALDGRRGHLTHIQFHSYGGGPDDQGTFQSKVSTLVDYVAGHPNISVDVGQVLFGETTSMTADGPVGHYLARLTGRKWVNCDVELEAGCGIVPITYQEKSFVHALQWAIGLEWFLLMPDPWRIALTTDHPNGASFLAYPEIIQLLMDRNYRQEVLQRLPPRVRERSVLADLSREYTLAEIAIITRAAPARLLGLGDRGHLGAGARADVTVYTPGRSIRAMFELPRWVIKEGVIIAEQGEIRQDVLGKTLHVTPEYDEGAVGDIRQWFDSYASVRFANFPIRDEEIASDWEQVTAKAGT